MANAYFEDGSPQLLYYPDGHPLAGVFKGMENILLERGYDGTIAGKPDARRLQLQCGGNFKCEANATQCCMRRLLYSQQDFKNIPSLLETQCAADGIQVVFLPKFHCELNFIEQCWCHAKREYRKYPKDSSEAALLRNVKEALNSVPLQTMQK